MNSQTKGKGTFLIVLSIVFATLGLIALISNIVYYAQTFTYYLDLGYAFSDVFSPSYVYAMIQPLEFFWGVAAILLGLHAIVKRLDRNAGIADTDDANL